MEEAELRSCVEEHADYLFRYAVRRVRDDSAAEDLVQEVFLAATKSYSDFRGASSARTWLVSILRHKIIDRVRSMQGKQFVSFVEGSDSEVDGMFEADGHFSSSAGPREWGLSPEEACERSEFREILKSCLEKIPAHLREIFLKREVEESSREEIAAESGVTPNNIGVMLHRTRLLLRDCIQIHWLKS